MPLVLAGATSGSTTLTPVDAVTATITLPSVTGTLGLNTVHTRQVFLSGTAATYTTPANCRQIVVRMKGGGGAGASASNALNNGNKGGNGGVSIFNSIEADFGTGADSGTWQGVAGPGSVANNGSGAVGGTGGTGTASVRIAGAGGTPARLVLASATDYMSGGGTGGGNGGGQGNVYGTGFSGVANSGGGGGGGSPSLTASFATMYTIQAAGGGGEGEYVELLINSPSATYTYTVGAGGTAGGAGTAGNAGGAGGSGYVIVDEYY
jgi:hypothetical protein